jgi:putative pyruvate formate lyase activating enzyme
MATKGFILPDGRAIIVDPRRSDEKALRELCPGFKVESQKAPRGFVPGLVKCSDFMIQGMWPDDLKKYNDEDLWTVHNRLVKLAGGLKQTAPTHNWANILDIKMELARRILEKCDLCGLKCGVDRFETAGKCGLRDKAFCAEAFLHICEEAVINPSINVGMTGCSMSCIYCQAYERIEGWKDNPEVMELTADVWNLIEWEGAETLEFVGGSPTESILGILNFLDKAPKGFALPVVWDDHAYGSEKAYTLLNGLVDIFLPDLRYGNDACAKRLSGVPNYWQTATSSLKKMMEQNARVIVRILILPGHTRCCNKKALEWLSQCRQRLWISIMDQYVPMWKAVSDPEMGRIPTREEVQGVYCLAKDLGLRDVNKNPEDFWKTL